jgi:hypothetical protein
MPEQPEMPRMRSNAIITMLTLGICLSIFLAFDVACADGSKTFVARPQLGAAILELPSTVNWRTSAKPSGSFQVVLNAAIDVRSVLANIKTLSAKALDRSISCGDLVKILSAAAKLTSATAVRYDLSFHYVKRICAGYIPVEFAANVSCSAKIGLSAARSIITIDVQGARAPPCRIVGAYQSVSDAVYAMVGIDVFKRHRIDLAQQLPPEFKGVTISIRSLAFDLPPAPAMLRISGDSTMSAAQFKDFVARIEAAAPKAN